MPIVSVPHAYNEDDLYVDLRSVLGRSLFLKCEGFNFAGSVKLKTAAEMVESASATGCCGATRSWSSPRPGTSAWR